MYINSNHEIYTNIDLDYYHQKNVINISILGIKGNNIENSFSFNSILSNNDEDLLRRFSKNKPILILKNHKVIKSDIKEELDKIGLRIKESPRNIYAKEKRKLTKTKDLLTNQDIKCINQLLLNNLHIQKGEKGKKSIKVIKNDMVLEKGIRLDLKSLDTYEKIADYINKIYDL